MNQSVGLGASERIVHEVSSRSGRKLAELAWALEAHQYEANWRLTKGIAGRVQHNAAYHWVPRRVDTGHATPSDSGKSGIFRISNTYPMRIGPGSGKGVSAHAFTNASTRSAGEEVARGGATYCLTEAVSTLWATPPKVWKKPRQMASSKTILDGRRIVCRMPLFQLQERT